MADHHQRHVLLFLVLFSCFINTSYGYQFVVGGRDGWVSNPSENYNQWAQRNRFRVNDTLLFKYKNGSDSVVVVKKKDYDNCSTANPILKFEDGNSVFKFDRSGPFYFVSGNKASCDQGQKLIVVVLAVRSRPSPPPTAPTPSAAPPKGSSPSTPPTKGSPAPTISPSSPSPSGRASSPASSPSTWSPSPAPGAPSPAGSPGSPYPETGAPSPAGSPLSPSPSTGTLSPADSPWSSSPASGAPGLAIPSPGPSTAAGAPGPTISGSGPSPTAPGSPNSSTPGTGTPADVNSPSGPPLRSFAAPPCTPSILFVSFVLSLGLGGFIVSN